MQDRIFCRHDCRRDCRSRSTIALRRETYMTRTINAIIVQMLLWAGTMLGQQRTDWISTLTDPAIQYRPQVFDQSKVCYVEFRDQQQGSGSTTFDVAVDYTWTDSQSDKRPTIKTDSEHIVT